MSAATGSAAPPTPVESTPRRSLDPIAVVALAGLALAVYSALGASESNIGPYGLVQALPALYFVALAVLALGFAVAVSRSQLRTSTLVLYLLISAFLLAGTPSIIESQPRFATAWLHAHFVDQYLQGGSSLTFVDARFNWPGFFTAAAVLAKGAGLSSSHAFLRWAPVAATVAPLLPLYVIGRRTISERATWLGLMLFLLVNWVGQNYFAPQAAALVAYLTVIALLVAFFRTGRLWLPRVLPRLRRAAEPEEPGDVPTTRAQGVWLIMLVLAVTGALAVSHQLTPPLLVIAVAALIAVGRQRLHLLVFVLGVIVTAWISLGAVDFWRGHLSQMFGGMGSLHSSLGQLDSRYQGSTAHLRIVGWRTDFSLAVWGLAAVSWVLLWLTRRRLVTLAALFAVPVVTVTQAYGGEIALRIFLFSSPFAALMIAEGLVRLRRPLLVGTLTAALVAFLFPTTLLLRFGNESYERVTSAGATLAGSVATYVPSGSTILTLNSYTVIDPPKPVAYHMVTPADSVSFFLGVQDAVRYPLGASADYGSPFFLMVSPSQVAAAQEVTGMAPGWFDAGLLPALDTANGWRLLFHVNGSDAYLFERVSLPQRVVAKPVVLKKKVKKR